MIIKQLKVRKKWIFRHFTIQIPSLILSCWLLMAFLLTWLQWWNNVPRCVNKLIMNGCGLFHNCSEVQNKATGRLWKPVFGMTHPSLAVHPLLCPIICESSFITNIISLPVLGSWEIFGLGDIMGKCLRGMIGGPLLLEISVVLQIPHNSQVLYFPS